MLCIQGRLQKLKPMYRRNEAEFKGILFNGPDLYLGVSSNLCNGEKENRSVSVFVSEIGPDFSPDIKGHPKMGFRRC